jgi:hypothetical protein
MSAPKVVAQSALRTIGPARQRQEKLRHGKARTATWPELIEEQLARVRSQLETRKGALYDALRDVRDSLRHIRSDGLPNLHSTVHVLVTHSDRNSGFIGDRRRAWLPHRSEDLAKRAFGEFVPGEVSPKRLQRWFSALRKAGFAVLDRVKVDTPRGPRATVAIKYFTEAFFRAIGLDHKIKARRIADDRAPGEELAASLARLPGRSLRKRERSDAVPSPATVPAAIATPPPAYEPKRVPASKVGAEALDELLAKLR